MTTPPQLPHPWPAGSLICLDCVPEISVPGTYRILALLSHPDPLRRPVYALGAADSACIPPSSGKYAVEVRARLSETVTLAYTTDPRLRLLRVHDDEDDNRVET